jgi:hypothetical protein
MHIKFRHGLKPLSGIDAIQEHGLLRRLRLLAMMFEAYNAPQMSLRGATLVATKQSIYDHFLGLLRCAYTLLAMTYSIGEWQ